MKPNIVLVSSWGWKKFFEKMSPANNNKFLIHCLGRMDTIRLMLIILSQYQRMSIKYWQSYHFTVTFLQSISIEFSVYSNEFS